MKKTIMLFSLLLAFSCEDKDEAAAVNLDGTYKLSMESSECDGELDVIYITIDGLAISNWDYDGDDCDNGDDCYFAESFTATIDGDALSVPNGPTVTMVMARNGTNGLKVSYSYVGGIIGSEIWDYESSEIKTYSPICN